MGTEQGKKATISGMKKPFNHEETKHTQFKAQDGPFMMMGNKWESCSNKIAAEQYNEV